VRQRGPAVRPQWKRKMSSEWQSWRREGLRWNCDEGCKLIVLFDTLNLGDEGLVGSRRSRERTLCFEFGRLTP
jgi:hypothetical protein